jgi:acyl-CoA thioester hydrolase
VSRDPPRPREAYKAWQEIGTRWADNDAYGHVNNAVHYQWFDTVVNGWLIARGLLDIGKGDPIGVVAETGCRYLSEIIYPEPVEIGLGVERLGRSSVRFVLGVFAKCASAAAAEGHFVHVYVDRAGHRPAPLPPEWRSAFESIAL